MIKKFILQYLIPVIVIFSLTAACILLIVNVSPKKKENSLYEVNVTHDGLVQTIACYLVRPIIESVFDRYIEKNGLADYLNAQKEAMAQELLNFQDINHGNGNEAFCGQKVSLQVHKVSNTHFSPFFIEDITLEIGKERLKELSLGVIGMREGGERMILASNNSYYVKLIKVHNVYPSDAIMIFDNLINRTGKSVKCGDHVVIKYNIKKHNGKLQVENKILEFTVGDKQVPLAIELGVIGMKMGNNRTIISSPDILTVTNNIPVNMADFDKENISIITLSLEQ
ncbi:peptidylprolyl isomerase [Wolbachia pipientis]|uniref:Peptidyl-prolyl cis-trans isomerase n=1 Tax=Wolbachia pipientis TaxID=955 RepID=A0A1E7QJE6_WOLPI|nr:FKBP-type peptidyl-prolyl cis-trans isomerase [Wolbachia pipientis]OEY86590.1 peptidylprolyl isomerase [Wolbachia pipientis]